MLKIRTPFALARIGRDTRSIRCRSHHYGSLFPALITSHPFPPTPTQSQFWVEKYEKEACRNWDIFYKNNTDQFFKDRHYFAKEFPDVFGVQVGGGDGEEEDEGPSRVGVSDDRGSTSATSDTKTGADCCARVFGPAPRYALPSLTANEVKDGTGTARPAGRVFLEVGCGVGNTAFPLLALDKAAAVYCCDFSQRAVELVEARKEGLSLHEKSRINPFVCDITRDPLTEHVPPGSVDVCTMVFVLSAVSPEKFARAIRNVSSVMKPGGTGRVLVRDYACGDLAQSRFASKTRQKLSENFYVRGDGTRAYYFSQEELTALFAKFGMEQTQSVVHEKTITNRSTRVDMERRWIQASFASAAVPAEALPAPPPWAEPEWAARARLADRRKADEAVLAEKAKSLELAKQTQAVADLEKELVTCTRGTLERVVLGIARDGAVESGAMLRRLQMEAQS